MERPNHATKGVERTRLPLFYSRLHTCAIRMGGEGKCKPDVQVCKTGEWDGNLQNIKEKFCLSFVMVFRTGA